MKFNKEEIIKRIKKNSKKIIAVYLFGSFALGKTTPLSDIDICIIGELNDKEKSKIFNEVSSERIDISFFDELPIWIKARVFRDGKCLVCNNKVKLNLIKLITLKEYLDFKPLIEKDIQRRFGNV